MGAPFNNLRSKLDRACVAYLQANNVVNSFPANQSSVISVSQMPLVVVRSHSGVPALENRMGGVWLFQVEFGFYGLAANQPGQNDAQQQRIQLDTLLATVCDLISESSTGQDYAATAQAINVAGRNLAAVGQDNLDMADFTIINWYPSLLDGGNPKENASSMNTVWKEVVGFEAVCCARNVS